MFFLSFWLLRLLVFMLTSNAATVNKAPPSAKAAITEARFNNLINNGGSFGGAVVVNGNHTITGTLHGSGGTLSVGDHIDVAGNNVNSVGALSGSGGANVHFNNAIGMNTNDIASAGHVTASQIGPGGTRANLNGVPFTGAGVNQVADRADYILNTLLTGCNVSY